MKNIILMLLLVSIKITYAQNETKVYKYGFVDSTGRQITKFKYDEVKKFKGGLAGAKFKGKWGFINEKGTEITPFKYDEIHDFYYDMAGVRIGDFWGFINREGVDIILPKYDEVYFFSSTGSAFYKKILSCDVEKNKKKKANNIEYGIVNKEGLEKRIDLRERKQALKEICKQCNMAFRQKNEETEKGFTIIRIKQDNNFSLTNEEFNINESQRYFSKKAESNDRLEVIEIIPVKYDQIKDFHGDFAAVSLNNKWGFVDSNGNEIIPLKYDCAQDFNYGLAAVELNGKWGFINTRGKEITEMKYDRVSDFQDVALVFIDNKYGIIDKTGKEIIPITKTLNKSNVFQ
ncbi:WG repeat-containing protein [Flavobacterium sp. KJJ]|uniref:WG repeat-containing protein n=1 Tax=Flavobacterium sp. KJJ TaxID=1270193 RepID=UPI0004930346|nr:WG repeat-containing protein [Flavobacterium sp. KJJ]